MSLIHPTAIISPNALIDSDVKIGPYCIIDGEVKISSGTNLIGHVYVSGNTVIGKNNTLHPFSSIGGTPQDKKYSNGPTKTIIGHNNEIREYVTINRGTELGGGETIVGDNCLLMSCTHVAHDCILHNNIVIANGSLLAGHVIIEDNVRIGGMSGILQFCQIGKNAMIGGMSSVRGHVIPFSLVKGDVIIDINLVGLRRMGMKAKNIKEIKKCVFSILKQENKHFDIPEYKMINDFIANMNPKIPLLRSDQNV